jgi:hypothetical protein
MSSLAPPLPWYREPWPWILMAIPAVSVVVGMIMLTLAITTNDGLVADDYYKRGLAINKVIAREATARAGSVRAQLWMEPVAGRVRIRLEGDVATGGRVQIAFVHPTRAGLDRTVVLAPAGGGLYEGVLGPLAPGRWLVTLEDERRVWRVTGALRLPGETAATLAPGGPDS